MLSLRSNYGVKTHILFCNVGVNYSAVVKPADQEMTTIEKILCYSQVPRGMSCHTMQGHKGSTRVGQKAERVRGKCEQGSSLWFSWEVTGKARSAGSVLASLNNPSRLWGYTGCSSCLLSGPEAIVTRGKWPWVWQPHWGGCGDVGFGLVSFHMKGVLKGKSFTISRNCLALGGAVLQSARPLMSNYQKYRK